MFSIELSRNFNLSVTKWLHENVYKVCPIQDRVWKRFAVALVSLIWHSFRSCFIFANVPAPFYALMDIHMEQNIRSKLSHRGKVVYDLLSWLSTTAFFTNATMLIFLKSWQGQMKYLQLTNHFYFLYPLVMFVFLNIWKMNTKNLTIKQQDNQTTQSV